MIVTAEDYPGQYDQRQRIKAIMEKISELSTPIFEDPELQISDSEPDEPVIGPSTPPNPTPSLPNQLSGNQHGIDLLCHEPSLSSVALRDLD